MVTSVIRSFAHIIPKLCNEEIFILSPNYIITSVLFSSQQEAYVAELDAKSGASLKLTVLNKKGRIWTMVAGGGASVIYRCISHMASVSR